MGARVLVAIDDGDPPDRADVFASLAHVSWCPFRKAVKRAIPTDEMKRPGRHRDSKSGSGLWLTGAGVTSGNGPTGRWTASLMAASEPPRHARKQSATRPFRPAAGHLTCGFVAVPKEAGRRSPIRLRTPTPRSTVTTTSSTYIPVVLHRLWSVLHMEALVVPTLPTDSPPGSSADRACRDHSNRGRKRRWRALH